MGYFDLTLSFKDVSLSIKVYLLFCFSRRKLCNRLSGPGLDGIYRFVAGS